MSAVILAQSSKMSKKVGNVPQDVAPFFGADREGDFAQMGVGILVSKGSSFWGLAVPHLVVQSWRAMQILAEIPEIRNDTLCACWYAARREVHLSDRRYLVMLEELLGITGKVRLLLLRNKILSLVPTAAELEEMLKKLSNAGVDFDVLELREEIKAGRLEETKTLSELLRAEERRQLRSGRMASSLNA